MVLAVVLAVSTPKAATAQAAVVKSGGIGNIFPQIQTPEGSWVYQVSIPGYDFTGVESYHLGGTYSEADHLSFAPFGVASAGHGVWQQTGPKTFLLTYVNLTFDGFGSGNPTGTLKVTQKSTIDKTGNVYTGSGDYTYYDLEGHALPNISGTFTIKATRIVIEAPK
jgi:hypothetical protein